jgi:hypothetical protein
MSNILITSNMAIMAVLIASVVRTRFNDMDKILREEDRAAAEAAQAEELSSHSHSHHTDTILKDD